MVPRREVRSGVVLVRGGGGEVANRVVPGVVVVNVVGFPSVRGPRLFEFISSILLSPVSRVKQRVASCSYVSRSSKTGSSIRCR